MQPRDSFQLFTYFLVVSPKATKGSSKMTGEVYMSKFCKGRLKCLCEVNGLYNHQCMRNLEVIFGVTVVYYCKYSPYTSFEEHSERCGFYSSQYDFSDFIFA